MKITKSELKQLIKECIKEELGKKQLKESLEPFSVTADYFIFKPESFEEAQEICKGHEMPKSDGFNVPDDEDAAGKAGEKKNIGHGDNVGNKRYWDFYAPRYDIYMVISKYSGKPKNNYQVAIPIAGGNNIIRDGNDSEVGDAKENELLAIIRK